MAIEVEAIDELDTTAVSNQLAVITQLIQEDQPTLETNRGPLRDITYKVATSSRHCGRDQRPTHPAVHEPDGDRG